jgi:signal transduction histidine kinase
MRLTVQTRLVLVLGLMPVPFMVATVLFHRQSQLVSESVRSITEVKEPSSNAAHEMEINLIGTGFAVLGYLHDRDPVHLERIRDNAGSFQKCQQRYQELEQSAHARQLGAKVDQGYTRFRALGSDLVRIEDEQTTKMNAFLKDLDLIVELLDTKIQASINQNDPEAYRKLQATMDLEINSNGIAKGLGNFLRTRQPEYKERVLTDVQDFQTSFHLYRGLPLSAQEKEWATEIERLFAQAVTLAGAIMALDIAEQEGLAEFVRVRRELGHLLHDEVQSLTHQEIVAATDAVHRTVSTTRTLILGLLVSGLLLGGVLAVVLARSITKPVSHLIAVSQAIARGELSQEARVTSHDEFRLLAESFNQMVRARRQAEDSERMRADELARSNAELEQFAYVASHDLREPLRMVQSFCGLLQDRYGDKLDERANKYINFAVDGATRMQGLVDDLLEFARVGHSNECFDSVGLDDVVRQALTNLEAAIVESGATIEFDRLPTVRGDARRLTQVFQNLIGNAIKFRGAPPPAIQVSACREGEAWRITVADNGIGIDPKHFQRLFVVFRRLHSKDEYPGTGIGLALCKRIVELHGGRIWLDSQPGRGTSFHFCLLPAEESSFDPDEEEAKCTLLMATP